MRFKDWLDKCDEICPLDYMDYVPPVIIWTVFAPVIILVAAITYWGYHLFVPEAFRADKK